MRTKKKGFLLGGSYLECLLLDLSFLFELVLMNRRAEKSSERQYTQKLFTFRSTIGDADEAGAGMSKSDEEDEEVEGTIGAAAGEGAAKRSIADRADTTVCCCEGGRGAGEVTFSKAAATAFPTTLL